MTETTTVWRHQAYGRAEGVGLAEVRMPQPGRGEVVLRMRATGLNAADLRNMHGDPLLVRAGFGLRRPRQGVRGMDVAGVVVAVAPDVVGVELGEEVVCELSSGGGLAGFVAADARRLVPIPPGVTPVQAAALPMAGGTAWQALDAARVGFGGAAAPRVLVLGASGGVGTFAVQLAALRGAEVWASCAERNAKVVEGLGAAHVLDHRTFPLRDLPEGHFDAVLDIAGDTPLRDLRRLIAPHGAVVLVTGHGGPVLGPVPRLAAGTLMSIGSKRPFKVLTASAGPEVLAKLLELAGEGAITPVIEREYPFVEAAEALAHVEAGHTVGKVVVRGIHE